EEEHAPSPPPNFNINPPIEVSNLSDNCQTPAPGSLRAAMILANQQPGQDEIVFAAGIQGSITLDCCLPPVLESLDMHGPGAGNLRLDASNTHLCNVIEYHNATPGQQQFHSLHGISIFAGARGVQLDAHLYLHVTECTFIENGCAPFSTIGDLCGAIRNNDGRLFVDESSFIGNYGSHGPAILQWSLLSTQTHPQSSEQHYVPSVAETTILKSTFISNEAHGSGGAISNMGGGSMEIFSSTFSDNHGHNSAGAIYSSRDSALLIFNSTLSGNHTTGHFGAIEIGDGLLGSSVKNPYVETRLVHTTIAFNEADDGGAIGWLKLNDGDTPPEVILHNSILAKSVAGNCEGHLHLVGQNNIQDDNTCVFHEANNRSNLDPMLEPLDHFGGPTLTHGLQQNSPAIDTAGADKCLLKDQRGAPRPMLNGCDVGAFEFGNDQDAVDGEEDGEEEHGDEHDHGFNHNHDDDEEENEDTDEEEQGENNAEEHEDEYDHLDPEKCKAHQ
ncbi:MAG: choice-of-anchor Q domain-containing protein, partial [Myxococcota bacterium]|nr:choice-of-anchor Q domain-containing protein [Myxococcota bacterium]